MFTTISVGLWLRAMRNINLENEALQILRICPPNITLLQKLKTVKNSKNKFF